MFTHQNTWRKRKNESNEPRRNVSFKLDSESSVRGLGVSSSYSSGCLISETQEPQWRCLTPRNFFFDCSTMPSAQGRPASTADSLPGEGKEGRKDRGGRLQ
jgi:hypothetical protein